MRVLICHGKESSPESRKLTNLANIAESHYHEVMVPDFRPDGPSHEDRLKTLLELCSFEPLVLVGSSMGAWMAMAASQRRHVVGLFLLAPAIGQIGPTEYPDVLPWCSRIQIVHGLNDDVVPYQRSVDLVGRLLEDPRPTRYELNRKIDLRLVSDDHRLHASMFTINDMFERFIVGCAEDWTTQRGTMF